MATIKLLDTNIILYYLAGKLNNPLPDADYYTSVITEIELLSYSQLDVQSKKQIKKFLNELTIVGLEQEIKELTIDLRTAFSLKLPDAIIAATAIYLKADLLSNDRQFQCISDLSCEQLKLVEK